MHTEIVRLAARLSPGDAAPALSLPTIDGTHFALAVPTGRRHLVSFYRFATCPFCNLRLRKVIQRAERFGPDFGVVGVFDAPLEHLTRHAAEHRAPFPILADASGGAYRAWRVERSFLGMLRGMILRMPTLLRGLFAGYFPFPPRGSMLTMPADFLIDEAGVIRVAHYGADEGDHLSFDAIEAFARGDIAGTRGPPMDPISRPARNRR